ncbi:UNKNOWN [Stylonychia lemnae]|uniref:Saposin B-type domain-containing protein n=1 Tax=Stylonychia lemnae TaxID=5949 RepID=A0A078A664_STYLE|nr:UNKNOWN [Stylonychia lemnae]|eukprot:CDW77055.1 UNKNOWN [Stylonychia lemnae]
MKQQLIFLLVGVAKVLSLTQDQKACSSRFIELFSQEAFKIQPMSVYANLTTDICFPQITNIQHSLKPTICAYQGLFVIEYIDKLGVSFPEKIRAFADDYCKNIQEAMNDKLQLINILNSYQPDYQNYTQKCEDYIFSHSNMWFDPTKPSDDITIGVMCEAYQELFTSLKSYNPALKYEDAIIYTYAFIYQTLIDRYDMDFLNVCVDSQLQANPEDYCNELMSKIDFILLNEDEEKQLCSVNGKKMKKRCHDIDRVESEQGNNISPEGHEYCFPCAFTIGYMMHDYNYGVEKQIKDVFIAFSKKATGILKDASKELQQKQDKIDLQKKLEKSQLTSQIQLPA